MKAFSKTFNKNYFGRIFSELLQNIVLFLLPILTVS